MVTFKQKGDFKRTNSFLERCLEAVKLGKLDSYGRKGVELLRASTPIDSGKTADSWSYRITRSDGHAEISFDNSNINDGVNIAIILQYGHATNGGGYVRGRDYINPAVQPLFDEIADSAWKEITSK